MLSNFGIGYSGIGQDLAVTFKHSTLKKGLDENKPCKMSANDTASICADGDRIKGIVGTIDRDVCAVHLRGIFQLPYSGTAPTVGFSKLVADGNGGVKVDASGDEFRVFRVDTTDSTVHFYYI